MRTKKARRRRHLAVFYALCARVIKSVTPEQLLYRGKGLDLEAGVAAFVRPIPPFAPGLGPGQVPVPDALPYYEPVPAPQYLGEVLARRRAGSLGFRQYKGQAKRLFCCGRRACLSGMVSHPVSSLSKRLIS